ncbi:RolB family protein [Agrobacterium tumefaciens]|uniref:RolB family protein n=1 Tax=Agrobacterium tumefaciens TaxID=358 RepID=UPI00234115CE|nr:RolB family protein [Agrobacterium tumefaciens]WCK69425.1 RolB family protein [Agrobacterium tumefaciens]
MTAKNGFSFKCFRWIACHDIGALFHSYTFRQVREQLHAFRGNGGRINYSRNEYLSSYFLAIQASNEFELIGAVRNTFGQSKDVWKRKMPSASQPLDYLLIAVGCSGFLPEAALEDVELDGAI